MDLQEKKVEVSQAQKKLLKRVKGSDELEMSWWRTCAGKSHLLPKEFEVEMDMIIIKERFLMLSRGLVLTIMLQVGVQRR